MFSSSVQFLSKLAKRVSNLKFKITDLFQKENDLDDDFVGTST